MEQLDIEQLIKTAKHYQVRGQHEDALRTYQDALAIDPKCSEALHELGMIHFRSGNISMAITLLKGATKYDNRRADFHNNLGTILKTSGNLEAAEKAFRKALTLDRNLVPALVNIGSLLLDRLQVAAALKALNRAVDLAPENSTALSTYAEAKKMSGDVVEALSLQLKAAETNPFADFVWLNIANTHMDLEQCCLLYTSPSPRDS